LLSEFEELGITVLGTSIDSVERLRRFRDKHELRFPLVSDSEREIGTAYGTLKSVGGSHNRDTVVIGADGTIVAAYEKVGAKGHAAQVLAEVRRLRAEARV
jgi:peroxiredoxin Q/BCP